MPIAYTLFTNLCYATPIFKMKYFMIFFTVYQYVFRDNVLISLVIVAYIRNVNDLFLFNGYIIQGAKLPHYFRRLISCKFQKVAKFQSLTQNVPENRIYSAIICLISAGQIK